MAGNRDIYGRPAVSESRGRTHERILAMQHAPDRLPGAEHIVADAPAGSIAVGIVAFIDAFVVGLPTTSRRAYERTMVLLLRDLEERGPSPHAAADALDAARLELHFAWRVDHRLTDIAELRRAAAHLTRLSAWLAEHVSGAEPVAPGHLRELATSLSDAS